MQTGTIMSALATVINELNYPLNNFSATFAAAKILKKNNTQQIQYPFLTSRPAILRHFPITSKNN